MEKEIDEKQIKLAERYADALQCIRGCLKTQNWTEDDANTAANYLSTLQEIEALDQTWDEDDITKAIEYLVTLQEIKKHKKPKEV